MANDSPTPIHPFAGTRIRLSELQRVLERESIDLIALAKAYAALAEALLHDVEKAGQSSMRFQAVCKALDLRTQKSELKAFLGTDSGAPS